MASLVKLPSPAASPRSQRFSRGTRAPQIVCFADGEGGKKALLIGTTGVTGRSAIEGMLATVDPTATRLAVLTRSPTSASAAALKARGLEIVAGDLDDEASLRKALVDVDRVYCHALSTDAAKADPLEVERAKRLAKAAAEAGVRVLAYNSSGGRGCGYSISQMEQKHYVEDIFTDAGVPLAALQATIFMEEWWKKYTRPSILKGSFPLSVRPDKPIQLLAARDIGLAAAAALQCPEQWANTKVELAGDELTPVQMCEAFAKAQGTPVKHFNTPRFLLWLLSADVYRIASFLSERGYGADVAACRARLPGMLTFEQFLAATRWGDAARAYDAKGIIAYDGPMPPTGIAQKAAAKA